MPLTRFQTVLWHGQEPVGICVFSTPPMSLEGRNRFFGNSGRWDRTRLKVLNSQMVMLSRVVLHPTYRGAGLATGFVRRSCQLCPFRWIETLTSLGRIHPFLEQAGFQRIETSGISQRNRSRKKHSAIYGGRRHNGKQVLVSRETFEKSRYAAPVYYIFDNRQSAPTRRNAAPGSGPDQHEPADGTDLGQQ